MESVVAQVGTMWHRLPKAIAQGFQVDGILFQKQIPLCCCDEDCLHLKTHAMRTTDAKDCYHPEIDRVEFDGIKVRFETQLKIVVVIYDNKMNWSKMASEMASRGRTILGRLGGLISKKDLCTIYESLCPKCVRIR